MNALDALKAVLLDLTRAVGHELSLIVGGGFGLYLRQEQHRQSGERTLLRQLPEPRATNDIDLFVRMEVLVSAERVRVLQQEIEKLGFTPVGGAEYFQWTRINADGRQVKIDLLCGPIGEFSDQLYTNRLPRVQPKVPKKTLRFHARQTEEAIELDRRALPIVMAGPCSDGTASRSVVHVPHPFTYMLMKLFAFDDRKNDEEKDVGRHHVMDLYRIVAMMTETEYEDAITLGRSYRGDYRLERARRIVADHFDTPAALGVLRLREHQLFLPDFPLGDFIAVLKEVFGMPDDQ
jgi:hypothetical protein